MFFITFECLRCHFSNSFIFSVSKALKFPGPISLIKIGKSFLFFFAKDKAMNKVTGFHKSWFCNPVNMKAFHVTPCVNICHLISSTFTFLFKYIIIHFLLKKKAINTILKLYYHIKMKKLKTLNKIINKYIDFCFSYKCRTFDNDFFYE